jgi:hypothetical protein
MQKTPGPKMSWLGKVPGRIFRDWQKGCDRLVAPPTATATTAIAAAAAAATAAIAAAAATTTTAALFARAGFVDGQATAIDFFQVESLNGRLSLAIVVHFDEAKSLAAAGVTILDDLSTFHLAVLAKQLFQALAGGVIAQVSNIQTHSHYKIP